MRKKSKGRVKRFDEEHDIVELKKENNAKLRRIEGLDGYEAFDPNSSFDADEFVEDFIDEGKSKVERDGANEYDALDIKRPKEEPVSKRKKKKQIRRRLIYLGVVVIMLAILAIPIHRIASLKIEETHLKAEQKDLKEQKKELSEDLERVDDPEYIEQQARKQLNLIKPGETLYVLPENDEDGNEEED